MNRIDRTFADLRAAGRRGLMPFVCGGFPGPGATASVLPALERAGASVVEVGLPFSDPIADGPVIAEAMHRALGSGSTPASVMAEVASVRGRVLIGLVAMCSVSIVHRMGGPTGFSRRARECGFDGIIVPDVPLEESEEIRLAASGAGLKCSLMVSPATPPERAGRILRASTGFVYLMARAGITGERDESPQIGPAVAALRAAGELPIACGFGVSSASHVRAVVGPGGADAAIVGSALVRRMDEAQRSGRDVVAAAEGFTRELAEGL